MRAERLSSQVTWQVTAVPYWRRTVRWFPTTAGALFGIAGSAGGSQAFLTSYGPDRIDPRLPPDDAELGTVRAQGTLLGRSTETTGEQNISIHADRAAVTPGLQPITLPLAEWTLADARCRSRRSARHRKSADARWEFDLVGPDTDVRLRGRWLLLARLGTLGHWDEPA